MKHFLKAKRKKSPEPPQQSASWGGSAGIAAEAHASQAELNVIPDYEGDGMGAQILFQDRVDVGQELPASGIWTSSTVGDTGYGNWPTGAFDVGGGINRPEGFRVTKRARKSTSVGIEGNTEKFGPLKVVLGAIPARYANREGIATVSNRIKNLLWRVVTLEEHFNSRPSNVADQRHRDELIRKLGVIEGQLQFSFEKPSGVPQLIDHAQGCEDVLRNLDDLQEAVLDYQVAQQTMTSDQGLRLIDPAEATALNNVRHAQQVEYRHGNRTGCLRGTRTAILDEIELWLRDFDRAPVYWLNGLAGTGKSTIAQTIAERAFADGRLGASFFCSRDFEDRSNLQSVFPTVAVQLARKYTQFRSAFIQLVRSDPEVIHESLYNQLKKLIVQPLMESTISTVIVIDALDECKDEEPASAILSVLGQFVAEVTTVKFFITGRPEPRIREGFRLPLLDKATDVFVLHEVEPNQVSNDIRLFFRYNFLELKRYRRGLDGWPTEGQVDQLCDRSGGLFVHAVASVRFIEERNSSPRKQLDRLLQSQGSSVFEGRTKFKTNASLDSLYMLILQEAFGDDHPENDPRVRSILGAVVLAANPLSPSTIAGLLCFESEEVSALLSSIHSLLLLREDIDHPVRPFHKSFPDFIIDPARCANPRFRVHPPHQHTELLVGCLKMMNQRLERNMCKLPDAVINSEVVDLKERAEKWIGQALEYSCRSWHKHLVGILPDHIALVLHRFLETKFLFWLEVLSVLGAAREAVDALEAVSKCEWPDVSPTLDLVGDCLRFVLASFEVINVSAPHIYHSALPLSPPTSIVRELYKQYACPFARVVRGLPSSWEPVLVSVQLRDGVFGQAVWSPCNRFIAAIQDGHTEILDATTLSRHSTFVDPNGEWGGFPLNFSADGSFLMRFNAEYFASWDFQTGGPLGIITPGLRMEDEDVVSSMFSIDGRMVAVLWILRPNSGDDDSNDGGREDDKGGNGGGDNGIDENSDTATGDNNSNEDSDFDDEYNLFILTFDRLSGTRVGSYCVPRSIVNPIWAHAESFRFATVEPSSITIWGAAFTSTDAPAEVESLPVPDEITGGERFLFFPMLSRLAFVYEDRVVVWDAKVSKLLLKSGPIPAFHIEEDDCMRDCYRSRSSFSSDGRFFACTTKLGEVYVWKESPTGYVLHQQLALGTPANTTGPRFSPNGESIITFIHSKLCLWPTKDPILSLSTVPNGGSDPFEFTLGFSPNGVSAAFARRGGNMVTIVDLQSGDSQMVIDMGVRVGSMGIAGSAVVVVDPRKREVASWSLPGGSNISSFRASAVDAVRITMLDPSPPSHYLEGFFSSISPDLSRIAIGGNPSWAPNSGCLDIYDASTGGRLGRTRTKPSLDIRFTRDGCEVWGKSRCKGGRVEGWGIVEDSESGATELVPLEASTCPLGVFLWESPQGYEVTEDGWVLSPTEKRLLWLPPRWRSAREYRDHIAWSGRFLGLLYRELSDVVILEFLE